MNILGFVGHRVSVTTTELCKKQPHKIHKWQCCDKILFIKTGGGPDLAHGLLFLSLALCYCPAVFVFFLFLALA